MNAEFIFHMEKVLDIYELEYNPKRPVVCFDEKPCQLIDHIIMPIAMKAGKVQREDYKYERKGTCELLCAVEPKAGKRTIKVSVRKTAKDYAYFLKHLATKVYANSEKIILVQDNLITHRLSSLYKTFPAEEARQLAKKFKMVYTPKHASWLNMAEIEFSAVSKQCLDRRIKNIKIMEKEIKSWVRDRNKKKSKINWMFTTNEARKAFKESYNNLLN